jgi:hypothetical protein
MSRRLKIPSSVVEYRRPRGLSAGRHVSKAEWLWLYEQAVRLGYHPLPAQASDPPKQNKATLTIGEIAYGSVYDHQDLTNEWALTNSVTLCGALHELKHDEDFGNLDFVFRSSPYQIPPFSLPFTDDTIPNQADSLVFLMHVFPSTSNSSLAMAPLMSWECFQGVGNDPRRLTGGYVFQLGLSTLPITLSIASCKLTSENELPHMFCCSIYSEPMTAPGADVFG